MKVYSDLSEVDYAGAERKCDIVMKGGITSGVVYPHAVCELARDYRFQSVGGTSAGAIAAAATAAAEYGRGQQGFNKLAGLPDELGAKGKLVSLFQPQRRTRGLYKVMVGMLDKGILGAGFAAARVHTASLVIGALPGAALLALALVTGLDHDFDALVLAGLAIGVLAVLLGAILGVVLRLAWQLVRGVPDNMFGICSGERGWRAKGKQALTPWLNTVINDAAGCLPAREPLTFGHLWAGPGNKRIVGVPEVEEPHLQLAMMTTNLTNRKAHKLPWETREWLFDPREFRKLFPEEVVKWMEAHPAPPPADYTPAKVRDSEMRLALLRPLRPLPAPADLPVVVATRMSLSFPVLLSAVPLWRLDMTREGNQHCLNEWRAWAKARGEGWKVPCGDPTTWPYENLPKSKLDPERCWFSDGGISSNFPVHFFDRLIPRWPTFAINLRPFRLGEEPSEDQFENTWMADRNDDEVKDWWYRLPARPARKWWRDARLGSFLTGAVRTMQNRADEAQMRQPGCRDRIGHVQMSKEEGGMNLTMPPKRIEDLTQRGRAAAMRLHEAYTPPDGESKAMTWDNHRWVRLRSALAAFEEMHGRFADGYRPPPERADEQTYDWLLRRSRGDLPKSYPLLKSQQRLARKQVRAIMRAAEAAGRAEPTARLAHKAPRPVPEGRIVPRD